MEDHRHPRHKQPRLQYHNPPPVAAPPSLIVPRSQYAGATRPRTNRSSSGGPAGPKYFSSPFRAPINQQERHDSFAEHQKSIANPTDDSSSLPQPRYPQTLERTSYAFFEPHATSSLTIPKKSNHVSSEHDRSDGGSYSSQENIGVVRQASVGHKAKPALTNVKRSDSTQTRSPYVEPKTPPPKPSTIEELNAAIAAAIHNPVREVSRPSMSRTTSSYRMPFDSPTSTYSQDFQSQRKSQLRPIDTRSDAGRISPLEEEFHTPGQHDSGRVSPLSGPTPHSEKSAASTNPLLGLGIDSSDMNSRIPEAMRPAKLNMKAVRDMETRGSVTSLPELIRRATKLASNLDRGKTASRLGIWDMFINGEHANNKKRESTYTDVLDAFPDPANGTPSKDTRTVSTWPVDSKAETLVNEKELRQEKQKPARRCCGLSMASFIVILIVVVLLIAAAVIIPIFLVVIPRQQSSSVVNLRDCSASRPCHNNGISVVDNNACSCICVDGFTGNDCSGSGDPMCVTANVEDQSRPYDNATMGSSIVSLLQESQSKMNIPLNASVLLSVFASNNLSCASENSLVQIDTARQNEKRTFIAQGLAANKAEVPNALITLSATPTTAVLIARQAAVETLNSIVYQAATNQASATGTATRGSNTIPTSTAPSPNNLPSTNLTSNQLTFAQLIVLYVLAESRTPSTAVLAQQNLEQYFRAGGLASGNSTVDVVYMNDIDVTADFTQLTINLSNGTILGGNSTGA